jgi:hypothetical protein
VRDIFGAGITGGDTRLAGPSDGMPDERPLVPTLGGKVRKNFRAPYFRRRRRT